MSPDIAVRPAVFHILLALAREDLHGLGVAKAIDEATGRVDEARAPEPSTVLSRRWRAVG